MTKTLRVSKSHVVTFRITDVERERLERLAKTNGITVSQLLRRWIENPPRSVMTITGPGTVVYGFHGHVHD